MSSYATSDVTMLRRTFNSCVSIPFLALLDYVRAHEIEIYPLLVFCVAIISEPIVNEQIPFIFQLGLPLGHASRRFLNFLKKKMHFQIFREFFFRFR